MDHDAIAHRLRQDVVSTVLAGVVHLACMILKLLLVHTRMKAGNGVLFSLCCI